MKVEIIEGLKIPGVYTVKGFNEETKVITLVQETREFEVKVVEGEVDLEALKGYVLLHDNGELVQLVEKTIAKAPAPKKDTVSRQGAVAVKPMPATTF